MARRQASNDMLVNSLVGIGTHFRGDLDLSGLLRIDGDYSGTIRTSGKVIVGSGGRADCRIEASVVVIGGVVRGEIYCTSKAIILSSAIVICNIYAPRLVAEEGTLIHGSCVVTGTEEFEKRRRRMVNAGGSKDFDRGWFVPTESFESGSDPFALRNGSDEKKVSVSFDPDERVE